MIEQLKGTMEQPKRIELIHQIAKYKHDNVLGGISTYRPVITLAWRDKVDFRPWPFPGAWREFQEIGLKK